MHANAPHFMAQRIYVCVSKYSKSLNTKLIYYSEIFVHTHTPILACMNECVQSIRANSNLDFFSRSIFFSNSLKNFNLSQIRMFRESNRFALAGDDCILFVSFSIIAVFGRNYNIQYKIATILVQKKINFSE